MNHPAYPFKEYASAYDALYHDKDYQSECAFIEQASHRFGKRPVKSILDLGCGTGGHAIPLAKRGYSVFGVDLSQEMLDQAAAKAESEGCLNHIELQQGDITDLNLNRKFDLVVCLFAVMSYMTTNEKLRKTFDVVSKHIQPGGLFVCDFWYGPAALRDLPTEREKVVKVAGGEIRRHARPLVHFNQNTVEVHYEVQSVRNGVVESSARERHEMRYLFLPELELFGELSALRLVRASDCCKLDTSPGAATWTISAIFEAEL